MIFDFFWPIQAAIVVRGATLWSENLLSSLKNRTREIIMRLEWLIANITAVESPARIEGAFFGNFGYFWPIQPAIVVGELLCEVEILSLALKTSLRIF